MGNHAEPEYPYKGANFWQGLGKNCLYVEFFETDGKPAFSMDAGISIHGGKIYPCSRTEILLAIEARKNTK